MKLPLHLPYNKNIKETARKLRMGMTEEENKLWYQYLRNYPIRFMRQRIIESYILDFYCAKYRLAIELDGSQHFSENGLGHDAARTELLNAYGITVIRFSNGRVRNDFGAVCREIDTAIKTLM